MVPYQKLHSAPKVLLTPIGQINSWRRIASNPCPKINPFRDEPY